MKRETQKQSENINENKAIIMGLLLAAIVMVAGFLPGEAEARKGYHHDRGGHGEQVRYVLHFGDAPFHGGRGNPSVLFLKKELLRQYPGVDVSNLRLKRLKLVAKSRIGRGVVRLRVGPEMTDFYQVAGRPHAFHSGNRHTFDRVRIYNPYRQSWGPWQLHLTGHFKVRRVVLVVEDRPRPQYGKKGGYKRRYFDRMYFGWRW